MSLWTQTDKGKNFLQFCEIKFLLRKKFLTFKDYIFKFGRNKYLMIWICDIKNVETTNIEKSQLYKSNIVLGLSLSPGGSKTYNEIL